MFDDQVVPGLGKAGNHALEAGEERRTRCVPIGIIRRPPGATVAQVINGKMQERPRSLIPQCGCKRGFAAAGGAMEEEDESH
ncbi:hypothetical protein MACH17_36020 [Phaeobacter inhibens]|nr:hypothetical protein MACH17_36020 [Phaeobacter inhibens]